jgi:hypothetical protein
MNSKNAKEESANQERIKLTLARDYEEISGGIKSLGCDHP